MLRIRIVCVSAMFLPEADFGNEAVNADQYITLIPLIIFSLSVFKKVVPVGSMIAGGHKCYSGKLELVHIQSSGEKSLTSACMYGPLRSKDGNTSASARKPRRF